MSRSLFSAQWYRVAEVKPRLKSHAGIHRHYYRNQIWYVLEDKLSGRYHRFTESAYLVMSLMDGERSLQSIWEAAVGQLGEDAPTQDETIQLLGQLHTADVLSSDVAPDIVELFGRHQQHHQQSWKQRLLSPLAIRIPLWDPDKFLNRTLKWISLVYSPVGALIWLALFMVALVQGVSHWEPFTKNIADTVLTPQNLLLMALLFPAIKALHEFGHASAVKVWGGEVHEIGIMFLVFMPVPYVDASASAIFRERYKRVIVGAAGMMAEFIVASLAMIYWVDADPGIGRTIAYNIILIAGVSALLFNINPLLRFDGYYIFADFLEIPNLAQRSSKYIIYLLQRYVLRLDAASSPVTAQGEKFWFAFYGIASFIYRSTVSITIALFIASKFFIVGVCLAIWSLGAMFVLPILKGLLFIVTDARVQKRRLSAVGLTVSSLAAVIYFIAGVPLPVWTNTDGVIWLPEKAIVRSGAECFITRLLVEPGSTVVAEDALIECEDPLLKADFSIAKSAYDEANVRYTDALQRRPAEASVILDELNTLNADVVRLAEKQQKLIIRSNTQGRFEVPKHQDLVGQYVDKGQVLGYVLGAEPLKVRVAVTQDQVALIQNDTSYIEVMRSSLVGDVLQGKLQREVPSAGDKLPSVALGNVAGGNIATDPRDPEGLQTFHKVFQFDIELPESVNSAVYGERVYVRVHHEDEVLSVRWYRSIRRLFLEKFSV